MNLQPSPEDIAFRHEVRQFVSVNLPSNIRDKVLHFRHLARQDYVHWHSILDARGWGAPSWPKEYGGTGWSGAQRVIFEEECMRAGAPRLLAHVGMIGPVLIKYGTEVQQRKFLDDTRSLKTLWCQGYSEPDAGSDLASLRTRAEREGGSYVVSGQKIWTSYAHWANWMFALVRTSLQGRPQEGLSFLLIDMASPGISVRQIRQLNGAQELNEVFFDRVRVPRENLVHLENRGWEVAKYLLQHERINQADIGLCTRMLHILKQASARHLRCGRPFAQDPVFRSRVMALESDLLIHQWTLLRALSTMSRGGEAGADISVLKLSATSIVQDAATLLMEMSGPSGLPFIPEALEPGWDGALPLDASLHGLASNYLDWRKIGIYGGTSEVTKNMLFKQIGSR